MGRIGSYRDLIAWQKAFALGVELYRLTARFPDHEKFGLTIQLRRGGVSVASNIAEGYGRGSTSDYLRFLRMARGCLYEIDTQLMLAQTFEYIAEAEYQSVKLLVDESERVLAGLIRSIDRSET
jgi:four helix bundle protein